MIASIFRVPALETDPFSASGTHGKHPVLRFQAGPPMAVRFELPPIRFADTHRGFARQLTLPYTLPQ